VALRKLIRAALLEDAPSGDPTTLATVPAAAKARARIIARASMVCAGLPLVYRVLRALDPHMKIEWLARDGRLVEKDRELLRCWGKARAILTGERTALNFLTHLSGIATLTRQLVEQLAGTKVRVRDTRKTLPGLRALEKYAVSIAGGVNHRFGLSDGILLKENHLAIAGGVKPALEKAQTYIRGGPRRVLPVQVEVRNEAQLREALQAGAQAVLLDNMTVEAARRSVELVRSIRRDCVVEISGGITLQNARAYAQTGADFLSSGALTHSAPAANVSLLVEGADNSSGKVAGH
jgi:nicotinate-nucleotide pyrophosphorylase (carboxylating)